MSATAWGSWTFIFAASIFAVSVVAAQDENPKQCSTETITALEALYFKTDGSEWKCGAPGRPCAQPKGLTVDVENGAMASTWAVGLSTPWKDAAGNVKPSVPSCCSWYGVGCGSPGEVTKLLLTGNALAGAIPEEIFALTALQHLDLGSNNLTGPIPPEIGALEDLQVLVLFDNSLEGPIPDQIAGLQKLEKLILSGNQLEGEIPPSLGTLGGLRLLLLNENRLRGTIPSELGNLTKLTHLYLHNNLLHGTIPREISDPEGVVDRGPQYLFVNGNRQPHRLSFHDSEDPEHFVPRSVVNYENLLSEDTHLNRNGEGQEETPAQKRERYKKLLEHKQRLMEKTAERRRARGHEEL